MSDDRSSGSSATMNLRPRVDRDGDAIRFPEPSALRRKTDPIGEDVHTLDALPPSSGEVCLTAPRLPGVVAGHQILAELGRGGMGVVYLARHLELGRAVAIKMILSAKFACAEELVRFRVEGETAASLHHANIVQVYEVGSFEDQPYMVLEYVEGGTLAEKLRERRLDIEESVSLIESLARAVHHAHTHGVIHRDLKPSNILLGAHDDPAHPLGVPKIADFGLAKHLDRAGPLTETGRVMGTPQYMAPEQAAGRTREIGPQTDVYSLGAILYELLTGSPPFESAASLDLMVQVMGSDPVPVRRLAPRVPRDLETIVAKCLEKEPGKRYAGASELADDLLRFREGRPIRARAVHPIERAWKWARRRPLIAGLLAGLMLVTLLGFGGVTAALVYALEGRRKVEIEREAAQRAGKAEAEARRRAETSLAFNHLTRVQFLWRLNSLQMSSSELMAIPEAQRGWDWRYLRNLHEGALHTLSRPGMPEVTSVAYSPDGRHLATAMSNPYVPNPDGSRPSEIAIWDASSERLVRTLKGLRDTAHSIAYSPDGRHIAAGAADGHIHVWDVSTGERVRWIRDPGRDRARGRSRARLAASRPGPGVSSFGEAARGHRAGQERARISRKLGQATSAPLARPRVGLSANRRAGRGAEVATPRRGPHRRNRESLRSVAAQDSRDAGVVRLAANAPAPRRAARGDASGGMSGHCGLACLARSYTPRGQ